MTPNPANLPVLICIARAFVFLCLREGVTRLWVALGRGYLYEQRQITASGHETTDTDPGVATSREDFSLERYVLGQNHYQIELLVNLDQVPESGALVVTTFPKPKRGSGFPARVFALRP